MQQQQQATPTIDATQKLQSATLLRVATFLEHFNQSNNIFSVVVVLLLIFHCCLRHNAQMLL